MKKFLSIILAAMLVIGMLPTAFAAVDASTGAITYEFNCARSGDDTTSAYLDGKTGKLAEAYMNYPENPADAGEKWAYLGTTITAAANVNKGFCYVNTTQLWTGNAEVGEWVALKIYVPQTGTYTVSAKGYQRKTYSESADLYIAYMNDDLKTKLGADASSRMPNTTTYGTVAAGKRSGASSFDYLGIPDTAKVGSVTFYKSVSDGVEADLITGVEMSLTEGDNVVLFKATALNHDGTAAAGLHPSSITLTPVSQTFEPTITVSSDKEEILTDGTATLTSVVTDSTGATVTPTVTYTITAGSDYVTLEGNKVTGKKAGTATITASATVDGKTITYSINITVNAKVFTYIFKRGVLSSTVTGNEKFTALYRPFYYKDDSGNACYDKNFLGDIHTVVDTTKDSEKWAVSSLGGAMGEASVGYKATSSITKDDYLQMVCRKTFTHIDTSGDGRFVLELNVPSAGSYDITASLSEYQYGADADIYIIKKTDSVTEISHEFLKDYPIIGRIGNVTGKVDGDVGNYTFASAGSYYFVLSFNSENVVTANNTRQYFNLKSITLSEGSATVETPTIATVSAPSFSATTNIPSLASVTVNGTEGNNQVLKPTRGSTVTLSAPEVNGYNFVGWMRGAYKDNGELSKFVDLAKNEDGTYSYKVWSSIYLTAVYEPKVEGDDGKVVRFWNNDGSFLGEKPVSALDANNLPTASLIGHTFSAWWVAENEVLDITTLSAAVTNAVAQYTANQYATFTNGDEVTLNGATQNSNKLFGTRVPCSEEGVTQWLRDGKVVAYGSDYNHFVWDGTHIHSSRVAVTPKPLVVLESTTVDGAYMIEYEAPAGYTIAEVGILFAASGTPDVNSAAERFSSQRGTSRGQFAAAPSNESYTVARGYMIYTDATGNAYVIYSK